jgi:hypothetical protein
MVTIFATSQNRTEQAVDAFSQHAAAPGEVEYLTNSLQSRLERVQAEERNGEIQAVVPGGL